MSEEIVVPSHFLLAEASCPSSSTVVQTDGSIVVTTESIVMVDSPVDKSSADVLRKRKTDVEISTSSSKRSRVLPKVLQRCPFNECSLSNTKMKSQILHKHLPKCFSKDRNSGNDHVMCLHALDSLSIAILGRTDLNELLNIVNSPGAIPDYSNIHPNLVEKMKEFSNHNSWQIPAKFSLHPINSKVLCCITDACVVYFFFCRRNRERTLCRPSSITLQKIRRSRNVPLLLCPYAFPIMISEGNH